MPLLSTLEVFVSQDVVFYAEVSRQHVTITNFMHSADLQVGLTVCPSSGKHPTFCRPYTHRNVYLPRFILITFPTTTIMDSQIQEASDKHPRPNHVFQYGTAGFRMKATLLDSVVFRVGLTAALRSRKLGGQTIGIMITASHNPPEDNGVKLVDPMGEMLEATWEAYSTELANAKNEDVVQVYRALEQKLKINPNTPARVIYARDTRASGPRLVTALVDGLKATGTEYTDYKLLTTPQLHYLTRCTNTEGTPQAYGDVSEKGYYEKLSTAFVKVMKGRKSTGHVTVDCANGVGGPKLTELLKYLPKASEGGIDIKIVNDDVLKPESLNYEVRQHHASCII